MFGIEIAGGAQKQSNHANVTSHIFRFVAYIEKIDKFKKIVFFGYK